MATPQMTSESQLFRALVAATLLLLSLGGGACAPPDVGEPVPRGPELEKVDAVGTVLSLDEVGPVGGPVLARVDGRGNQTFAFVTDGALAVSGLRVPAPTGGRHVVLLQLNAAGQVNWHQVLAPTENPGGGGPEIELFTLGADDEGRLVVSGAQTGGLTVGEEVLAAGAFLAGFSPEGIPRWAKTIEAESALVRARVLAFSGKTTLAIGERASGEGNLLRRLETPTGALLDERPLEVSGRVEILSATRADPGGTVTLLGRTDGVVNLGAGEVGTEAESHPLVLRIGGDGTYRAARVFPLADGRATVGVRSGTGVVVGGVFEGALGSNEGALTASGQDGFLTALGPTLETVWEQRAGHAVTALSADGLDRVRVAGAFEAGDLLAAEPLTAGAAGPAGNGFIAAIASDTGELLWAQSYSSDTTLSVDAIASAPDGASTVLGRLTGTSTLLGGNPAVPTGFILRLAP